MEIPLKTKGNRRCGILYYSEAKAARDKKARAKAPVDGGRQTDEVAASMARKGRGWKPEGTSTRRKIEWLLEKRHRERRVKWKFTGRQGARRMT